MNGEQPRDVEPVEDTTFVRPFIITGGAPDEMLTFERRHIVAVCEEPMAVGVPLGVAKVLVSDLVVAGRLNCRQPAELPLQMLERIRDHVRAL